MMDSDAGCDYFKEPISKTNALEWKELLESQEAFFLSLLKASSDLVQNGGARGSSMKNSD